MKVEAIKDGKGNIVITENSFEMLLACLDNQKFVHEAPQNGDSFSVGEATYKTTQKDIQETIDIYNRECRNILHQKYVFGVTHNGLSLYKKYELQNENTEWTGEDVGLVYSLFKDTIRKVGPPKDLLPLDGTEDIKSDSKPIGKTEDGWIVCEPTQQPWLIERPLMYDGEFLTISEDGFNNRPWTQEEINNITKIFNGDANNI